MISSNDLQTAYVNLYKQLRNYIWDYDTVERIAELEIAVHTRFPDINTVRSKFKSIEMDVRDMCQEDEELNEAVKRFNEAIQSDDSFYAKLDKLNEVNV